MTQLKQKPFADRGPQHLHRARKTPITQREAVGRSQALSLSTRKVRVTLTKPTWEK